MSKQIQIGDRVVCIDDSASFNRLRNGNEYIVEADYNGSPTVFVGRSSHCLERFQRVG